MVSGLCLYVQALPVELNATINYGVRRTLRAVESGRFAFQTSQEGRDIWVVLTFLEGLTGVYP